MADNLSPLVNLDLINQIYKTINAQITERVYDPQYYTSATLGTSSYKYVSAYISGNTSTGTLNDLTLNKASTGFTISGGTTSKTLTIQGDTSITGSLTVSAATNIIKSLTVGATATYTGAVTIRSAGSSGTTITGPNGGEAKLIDGTYTSVVRESFNTANTASTLVKRDQNGDILVSKVNGVTLGNSTASFTVTGGSSTSKTLTVNSAATLGSSSASENGAVTVKSAGTNSTTITGPDGKEAKLINGTYTTSATTSNSDTPTAGSLLKIGTVDAKKFLAGPASGSGPASYRTIVASDLPVASASADGIVTTEDQTFEGVKTFNQTITGSITGNAGTASSLYGLSKQSSQTWGIQTGTFVHGEGVDGCDWGFRKDCPNSGMMSLVIDGRFYQNEGRYACIDTSGGTITGNLGVNGTLNAGSVQVNSKVTLQYNSSTESLDFVFA